MIIDSAGAGATPRLVQSGDPFYETLTVKFLSNVTQASKTVVFPNTSKKVRWTPPSRVSPGGPSVIEKTNTQCMSPINLDRGTLGNWN